jgi:hypothetical protein
MARGNPKNLVKNTDLTPEELKARNSKAGKASGKARKEKKLMSQIYAEFLVKEHEVIGKDGKKKKLEGHALLSSVMSKILSRGDSASVSLFKEIREATEGNKIALSGELDCNINIVPVKSNK